MLYPPALLCMAGAALTLLAAISYCFVFGFFGFRFGGIGLWMCGCASAFLAVLAFLMAVLASLYQWGKRDRFDWWWLPSLAAIGLCYLIINVLWPFLD